MNVVKILWGSILSAAPAVGLDAVLSRAAGKKIREKIIILFVCHGSMRTHMPLRPINAGFFNTFGL